MPRFVLNNGKQYDISEQDIQEFAQSVEVDGLEIVGVISPENIEKLNEEAPPTEIEMISEEEKPKIELEELISEMIKFDLENV